MSDETDETDQTEENPKNRGNAGQGRRKGSLNKTTMAAKQAIALAAEGLGGVQGLIDWVEKDDANARIFWGSIYPKLLPFKLDAEVETGKNLTRALTWLPPIQS